MALPAPLAPRPAPIHTVEYSTPPRPIHSSSELERGLVVVLW